MKRGTKTLIWTGIAAVLAVTAAVLYIVMPRDQSALELTAEEIEWLEANRTTIRFAPLPNSPPIDYLDKAGNHLGLTADYIRRIEQTLGVRFELVKCDSWKDILERLKNREIDLVGSAQNRPERQEYLRFTQPYQNVENVIVVRSNEEGILSLANLGGKRIAIVDKSASYEYVREKHPEYRLVPVENTSTGFRMVTFAEVDAFITDHGAASHYIEDLGISTVRIAGDIDYIWELCLATRKDWPLLNSILDKTLATIPKHERKAIEHRWIRLKYIKPEQYILIVGAILVSTLLCAAAAIAWNRTLRKQVTDHVSELGRVRHSHAQAKIALGESEERFRILVESTNDMIWEMDRYGSYLYISPRVQVLLGYRPEELVGRSSLSLMVKEDSAQKMEALRTYTINTVIDREITTFIRKDGRKVVLESNWTAYANNTGELGGFRGVSRDITDRLESENALRLSEERFRNLVETTSDWIWEVDTDGAYTYASPQAAELLGYLPDDLLGKHFTALMPPTDAETIRSQFSSMLRKGMPIHSM
ncbi:MAG: PAS domain S-box protein, partial [Pontiella sp.]|nr:PAS domain S-box protein [Pontiella sp.]